MRTRKATPYKWIQSSSRFLMILLTKTVWTLKPELLLLARKCWFVVAGRSDKRRVVCRLAFRALIGRWLTLILVSQDSAQDSISTLIIFDVADEWGFARGQNWCGLQISASTNKYPLLWLQTSSFRVHCGCLSIGPRWPTKNERSYVLFHICCRRQHVTL